MSRAVKRKYSEVVPAQQSISTYTRVQKSAAIVPAIGKKLGIQEVPTSRKRRAASPVPAQRTSRRERLIDTADSSGEEGEAEGWSATKRQCRRSDEQDKTQQKRQTESHRAPVKGKPLSRAAPSRKDHAHHAAEDTVLAQSRRHGKATQTKLDFLLEKTRVQKGEHIAALSTQLEELVTLHKCFLKTVLLQFAHAGSNAPLDLAAIIPHISRAWGKRTVTIEDIRRCVAVESSSGDRALGSPFFISDYGRGKICIELADGRDAACINRDQLCRRFERNLRMLCRDKKNNSSSKHKSAAQVTDVNAETNVAEDVMDMDLCLGSLSLSEVPQATISTINRGSATDLVIKRGQQALNDLRSDMEAKKAERAAKQQQQQSENQGLLNADGTKMSLLDRLRLKQLAKAEGPLPPSGAEVQRRAALNRVGDVAATISMLSLANPMAPPRQAFTMAVLLEKLKDSLRVPLAREEGIACVTIIAKEVAPEWLKVVTIGGRQNVVVQRGSQPVDRVLQERVRNLLG